MMNKKMKTQLTLNKETVSNLDTNGMNTIKGGNDGDPITLYDGNGTTDVPVYC